MGCPQYKYAGRTIENEMESLYRVLETKEETNKDVRGHVARIESQFSVFTVVAFNFEESLKDAILLSSINNQWVLLSIVVSISKLKDELATWHHVKTYSLKKLRG